MSKVIRDVLLSEFYGRSGSSVHSEADTGLITTLLKLPTQDERFLRKLAQKPNGLAMLRGFLSSCQNGDRRELTRVVRRWAMKDSSRGAFLDLVDCFDKASRNRARAEREARNGGGDQ